MIRECLLGLVFLLISPVIYGQSYVPSILSFGKDKGLSSNEIYAIHKGSDGFMWIGTQYGLNRFDGQEFEVYSKENGSGLDFNIINQILEDGEGNLWLIKSHEKYEHPYSDIDINLYNFRTQQFVSFRDYFGNQLPFQLKDISFIDQYGDSSIFIRCKKLKKAFIYSSHKEFLPFAFPDSIETLYKIMRRKSGNLWAFGYHRIEDFRIVEINLSGEIVKTLGFALRKKVFNKVLSKDLIISGNSNLPVFESTSFQGHPLPYDPGPSRDNVFQSTYNEHQDLFWLCRLNGITVIRPDGEIIFEYDMATNLRPHLPLIFDKETAWLADKEKGLVAINLKSNRFHSYQFFDNPTHNSLRGIMKDTLGNIWFSTIYGMGTMEGNSKTEILQRNTSFTPFLKDKKGYLWFYEDSNLVRYEVLKKQKYLFQLPFTDLIWSLFEADNGEIWMGLKDGTCYALNPGTKQVYEKTTFPKINQGEFKIYHFQKRDKKSLWVCSSQGLFLIDWHGNILGIWNEKQESRYFLAASDIRHIYQGKEHEIWIASGDGGLFEMDMREEKLLTKNHYTSLNGLSSNSLHAIYADAYDYLWISSDEGLMQLDKRNGYINKYFTSDGLQHNEFNRIAHYQDKEGLLYFGGLYGLSVLNPEDFSKSRRLSDAPTLTIATYEQFSSKENRFKNLTADVLEKGEILLKPGDRFFKLRLSLLDFEIGALEQDAKTQRTYQYRIKGLYDWQTTKDNELIINSLPFGNYVMEIKARNENLKESANQLSLNIQVMRPFYLKIWFILSVFLLIVGGIWSLIRKRTQQLLFMQEAIRLRELDKMKSRFFANISHELRTPLTQIGLPLEYLIKNRQKISEEERLHYLQSAYSNKRDLGRKIDEILDLSQFEAGKLEVKKKALALQKFLSRVINTFETSAKSKRIQFQVSLNLHEQAVFLVDAPKLEMIVNNLLANALKFTPEQGKIEVVSAIKNDQLVFSVEDNGRGIPDDDLPFIFERYFQSQNPYSGWEEGSGIGLAICKELIELMGGRIELTSTIGEGSIFSFFLPLQKATKGENTYAKDSILEDGKPDFLMPPENPYFPNKANLLIVEDKLELRSYLQTMLAPEYNILTAADGEEALEILDTSIRDEKPVQLILSDVMMPKMDGFALLKQVKAHEQYCEIPFILLTAHADIQDKLYGLRIGVDDYISKPFEMEELGLRVRNLLTNVKNCHFLEVEDAASGIEPQPQTLYQPTPANLVWLKKVEDIVHRELSNNPFNMEDLASELCMSYSSMNRHMKQVTGLTPNRYIRTLRLQKAKLLLETQEVSTIKEVAYSVGFEGLTHFKKLFIAEFGKRPEDYLK